MTSFFGGVSAVALALILGLVALASTLLSPDADDQVLLSINETSCLSPDCLTTREVEDLVGFTPLEPSLLPQGYVLYNRSVPLNEIPEAARERIAGAQGISVDEVPTTAPPSSVLLEYRFQGRPYVPVIAITQTRTEGDHVQVRLREPDCGDELQSAGHLLLYGEGLGSVLPGQEPGVWEACPSSGDGPLGNVVFASNNVVVEQKAPLEVLSREQILQMAESMFSN